jgi:hypothetical protein
MNFILSNVHNPLHRVTRLIKISKQKPQREGHKHSPFSTSSPTSSFQAHPNDNSQEKLVSAQNELQACENHLNRKKQELEDVRTNVVKEGLWRRCRAMTQLGWSFNERGKEGLSALEGMGTPIPNGILGQFGSCDASSQPFNPSYNDRTSRETTPAS